MNFVWGRAFFSMAGQSLQKARTFLLVSWCVTICTTCFRAAFLKSFKKSYQPAFCSKQNQSYDCFNMSRWSEKRPFSQICQGHISKTARHTYLKICIFVSIVNVYKRAKFKTNRRRSSQKWPKIRWSDVEWPRHAIM